MRKEFKMNLPPHSLSLQEARQKLIEIKKGLAHKDSNLKKRLELEDFLVETQLKAHHTLLRAHQVELDNPQNAHALFNKAKEYESYEKQLIHQINLLDQELDLWEEVEETEIKKLKELIIHELIHSNTTNLEFYRNLKHQHTVLEEKTINIQKLIELLNHIEHLLTTIQLARKRIKSQGILSYIFGANPNFIVAQCLRGTTALITEGMKIIEEGKPLFTEESAVINSYTSLHHYLQGLEKDCQTRWNYRHLDALIENNFSKIENFIAYFDNFQTSLQLKKQTVEREIDQWLESSH